LSVVAVAATIMGVLLCSKCRSMWSDMGVYLRCAVTPQLWQSSIRSWPSTSGSSSCHGSKPCSNRLAFLCLLLPTLICPQDEQH
jgi:hypothetical protein